MTLDDTPKSKITNCYLFPKNGQDDVMFFGDSEGRVITNLDGMLICPLEMFTPRQIKMADKKYREGCEK